MRMKAEKSKNCVKSRKKFASMKYLYLTLFSIAIENWMNI